MEGAERGTGGGDLPQRGPVPSRAGGAGVALAEGGWHQGRRGRGQAHHGQGRLRGLYGLPRRSDDGTRNTISCEKLMLLQLLWLLLLLLTCIAVDMTVVLLLLAVQHTFTWRENDS